MPGSFASTRPAQPTTQRRPREVLRDDVAGASAEARAGMGARPDVPEAIDRRCVTRRGGGGTEEEVLVERTRPCVDVAADPVRVRVLHIGRRHDDSTDSRGLEILDVAPDPRNDPVGIRLAQLFRPPSRRVELTGRVALRPRGQLLELDPDHPRALGSARRVDGHRLPECDRGFGRKEAAISLVDGPRNPVEAGREVEQRRACEPLVALPTRQLVHRDVDLHLAAAVAEAPRRIAHAAGASLSPSSRS